VEGIKRLTAHIDYQLRSRFASSRAEDRWIVELEFEETYRIMLLLKKKQYMGRTVAGDHVMKGVAVKRSDMCAFAKDVNQEVLKAVLDDGASQDTLTGVEQRGLRILEGHIRALVRHGLPYERVVTSNKLAKPPAANAARASISQPHALVAYDHQKRTGVSVPAAARVPYVFTVVTDDPRKKSRCAMCPDVAQANGVPLNYAQIVETQIQTPLQRFLRFFGEDCVDTRIGRYVGALKACQERQLRMRGLHSKGKWHPSIARIRPKLPAEWAPSDAKGGEAPQDTRKRKQVTLFEFQKSERHEAVGRASTAADDAEGVTPSPPPSKRRSNVP